MLQPLHCGLTLMGSHRVAMYLRLMKCPASTIVQCSRLSQVMHRTIPAGSVSTSRTYQLKTLSSLLRSCMRLLFFLRAVRFALLFVLLRCFGVNFVIWVRYEGSV